MRVFPYWLAFGAALATSIGCGSNAPTPFNQEQDGSFANMNNPGGDDGGGIVLTGTDGSTNHVPEGGVFNDGAPTYDAQSCVPDAGGPGPIVRTCLPPTDNECDGQHDVAGFPPNGTGGNGFDDDCDGLVDEGCACDSVGATKTCYLVPASQTSNGVPVGWCTENSKGTVDCVKPSTEFAGTWSGECRGAQPPYADDVCAQGDFDCDGAEENSKTMHCSCTAGTVTCPTTPLQTTPYPPVTALPLKVDASQWFSNPINASAATNWKWTLSGGDCDNILPHPTFSIYPTANASGNGVGTQVNTLGTSMLEHGIQATAPTVSSSIYPAFSLSGDYLLEGEFDYEGQHYACTQKIQVLAPGIRAEACWDTESQGVDLDLHMARIDGFASCTDQGWEESCEAKPPGASAQTPEDCYYGDCTDRGIVAATNWYAESATSACVGWGSLSSGFCTNPRLDRDSNGGGSCSSTVTNPNVNANIFDPFGGFCGPENINVDAPTDGSSYAVAVRYYASNSGPDISSKAHVNIYCNGERIVSTGYNPVTGNEYPHLNQSGEDATGDMWKVGIITAHVSGTTLSCDVSPTSSQSPHASTDGSNAYCVDNTTTDGMNSAAYLTTSGGAPANANALCFH